MNYAKRAVKGTSIVFFISIAAAFLGYIIRMVLSRNLTPSEYGLFFAIFTLINFIAVFKYLGLGSALVKFIPAFQVQKKHDSIKSAIFSAFSISFFVSLIIAIILFFSSGFLAEHYFKSPSASWILQFFALIFVLFTFKDIIRYSFQGLQKMFPFALMYLTENLLILLSLILFFHLNLKLFGAILAYIVSFILIAIIYLPWLSKVTGFFKEKTKFSKKISKRMLIFGIPATISGVGSMIILYVDTLILTYFRSLSEVGIYNVVVPTAMILNFIAVSISQVFFPMVSELWAKKLKNHLSVGINTIYKYSFALIVPLVLIIFSFSKLFLRLLFGEQYVVGATSLQILVISMVFLMIFTITANVFGGLGKPKISMKINLFGASVNLILNIIFIPIYGIVSAAVTSLISYFLIMMLSMFSLSKFVKLKIPWLDWFKVLVSGGAFVLLIYLLRSLLDINLYLEAIICISVAGVFYLFLLRIFKVIDFSEIKKLFFN